MLGPPSLLSQSNPFIPELPMEIELNSIHIRPERQRKDLGDLTDLKVSLLQVGLINPVVIEQDPDDGLFYLIAGERRYTAWSQLAAEGKLPSTIKCTLFTNLDPSTRHVIELEENIKRKDLTWQEKAKAIDELFYLRKFSTNIELAEFLGLSEGFISKNRVVWANIDNPKVAGADTLVSAYTICRRESERLLSNIRSDMDQFVIDMMEESENGTEQGRTNPVGTGVRSTDGNVPGNLPQLETASAGVSQSPEQTPPTDPFPNTQILCANFPIWADSYSGPKFNLLHLDFPYGINHQKSEQGNTKNFDHYEDTPEIYQGLVEALVRNSEKLLSPSCHIICWLSLNFQEWTKAQFKSIGFECLAQPFIWYKSDNKGIIADTMCGMRNVGEYALVFVRERRPVVKNISNIFPHPCTKKFHVSEKPLAMERQLMSAFCDGNTRLLDPTCGSGTAIMASLGYGVEQALGLEIDPEIAAKAQAWLHDEKIAENSTNLDIDLEIDL